MSVRAIVRFLGELLITIGCVLTLFVVYQLFWTNIVADRAQHTVLDQLDRDWAQDVESAGNGDDESPPSETAHRDVEGLGALWIPRLGADYRKPIVEGTGAPSLASGIGRYSGSAPPGGIGNLSLAGHRATNGEPFADLPQLQVGDPVVVETADTYYTYVVDPAPEPLEANPALQLVHPHQVEVTAPVPNRPGTTPDEARLTLITCEPRWGSTHRLVVYGTLESVHPKDAGLPEALTKENG